MTRTTIPSIAFFSPGSVSAALATANPILNTTIFVTNLHCSSCVTHVNDTIGQLRGIYKVEVNLLNHTIFVKHSPVVTSDFVGALADAGFDIDYATTNDEHGRVIKSRARPSGKEWFQHLNPFAGFMTQTRRNHIANCHDCKSRGLDKSFFQKLRGHSKRDIESDLSVDSNPPTKESGPERHIATLSVSGMTCSSCVNTITTELKSMSYVEDVEINLVSHSATVIYRGTAADAQKVVDTIEDCGYGGEITKVEPLNVASLKAVLSIIGMTCGSCVSTVTNGLKDIEGVRSVNVSLVGNSATLSVTNEQVVAKVQEEIEDMGFECSLASLEVEALESTRLRTVEFEVTGMYCALCPRKITQALTDSYGSDIEIVTPPNLNEPRIKARYLPSPPSFNIRRIKATIESVDPQISVSVYHPPTMEALSRAVQRRELLKIGRHFVLTTMAVIPSFIIGVVYMTLVPESNRTRMWFEEPIWAGNVMRIDWAMLLMTIPVMFYGAGLFHLRAMKEIVALWRPGSKVSFARRFYRFGSMNLLISAGCSVAFFGSLCVIILQASTPRVTSKMERRHSITYFDTVTFLTFFILLGKGLQALSKAKTGDVVAELAKLKPRTAYLALREDRADTKVSITETRKVDVDLIEIGDVVSIARGASPPADGQVDQDGIFFFDESSLTGESRPVKKVQGDTVHTGSVNVSDPVRVKVTELGGKSTLDQIIAAVRTGQTKSAPVERFAERWTSYFAPIITLIAISTWIVWVSLGVTGILPRNWLDVDQGGWPFWSLEFAIAVFVVACPCGLGLAAPTALFVGGGLAAKKGILVQGGGEAFQEASQLDVIVFDKTGTLTEGRMRVTDLRFADEEIRQHDARFVIAMAKALEEASAHPIAKAIAAYCSESTLLSEISTIQISEEPGQGMRGSFQFDEAGSSTRYEACLGNERQLQNLGHSGLNLFLNQMLQQFQSGGCSTAVFTMRKLSETDGEHSPWRSVAVFAITDPIRAETTAVLRSLHAQKIEVHMCTGDNPTTARAVASQLDIPVFRVRAGATPQDKATYIEELRESFNPNGRHNIVAFVGDGTNDTPALTAADVSIALSSGSDIAMTSSSFILLNSNLETILHLVRLARRVFTRVKLNFAWAAVYNIALIPVAAGLFFPIAQWRLSPVWAALAMAMSSLSVVLSSLALRLPGIRFSKGSRSV